MKGIQFRYSLLLLMACVAFEQGFSQVSVSAASLDMVVKSGQRAYSFSPRFTVLYNAADPGMALKPSGLKKVEYNVLTWKVTDSSRNDFKQKKIGAAMQGDGFDDRILRTKAEWRTANIYNAGERTVITATGNRKSKDTVFFSFPPSDKFVLTAYVLTTSNPYPTLHFSITPTVGGYYSVGYTGAPAIAPEKAAGLWQPLIWQEKRMPDAAYCTPSFMATLPSTFVNDGLNTIGVMAAAEEIPFQPLPTLPNSRFGIALVNEQKQLQPQIYAPIPGGYLSKMEAGKAFDFTCRLIVMPKPINQAYEQLARTEFGFRDYRSNDIASLNTALDNMVDYSLSHFAWFIDSLKGCAYSTDVPGAVKNVSSLNPLELALVRDDSVMFEQRAYPLMEFMLSREKFLFALDSTQKIQSPSRKMKGPIAPLSELLALYDVFGQKNPLYLEMAKKEYSTYRVRNLDYKETGKNWINDMWLYKSTGDKKYLAASIAGADKYLAQRIDQPQTAFNDPMQSGYFFWPTFTGRWIEFLQLYEITGNKRYLAASREGARNYTMFTWMVPAIPDTLINVNKGGKAPMYWYLRSKGHKQMYYPEEQAPAWRLSEVGLTPESSGTSTGHRGIFMSNYAPWMLRLGYYTKDSFLIQVAKASIVGRYRNFPGYHINTERTTAYEKFDFPLHEHKDQSVNSFHYNHILPMASMLLDYLVTDAFVRSNAMINFPAEYMEGYAYLQNKMYGAASGSFYTENNVQLWMPARLLKISSNELNYIAARKGNKLMLAFTNQSGRSINTMVSVDKDLVKFNNQSKVKFFAGSGSNTIKENSFMVTVPANGIAAVSIDGAAIHSGFQQKILDAGASVVPNDYVKLKTGNAHAMLLQLGKYDRRLYVYLEDDDNKVQKVSLQYTNADGQSKSVEDITYPFEFTVRVGEGQSVSFQLHLTDIGGKEQKSETVTMGK